MGKRMFLGLLGVGGLSFQHRAGNVPAHGEEADRIRLGQVKNKQTNKT